MWYTSDKGLLRDTQYMTVEEQLFIFMCVVCQLTTNTCLAYLWKQLGENMMMVQSRATCYMCIKERIHTTTELR